MNYLPNYSTIIFVSIFLVVYLLILLRNTIRNTLDLYDFVMLSSVALIPAVFVFFPSVASRVARLLGVGLPLVIIFGSLFFITFIYLYRLVVKSNEHSRADATLVQEAGLLRLEIQKLRDEIAKLSGKGPAA